MSWLPLLLIAWVVVDVVIVAAFAFLARRAAVESATSSGSHPFVARALAKRRAERAAH